MLVLRLINQGARLNVTGKAHVFFPALRVSECAMTRWAIAARKAVYTNEFNLEVVRRSDQPIMDVQWDFIVIASNRRV